MTQPPAEHPDYVTRGLVLLTLVLIGLKLTHVLAWPWWLVTMPFWGPFAIVAAIFVVLGLVALVGRVFA